MHGCGTRYVIKVWHAVGRRAAIMAEEQWEIYDAPQIDREV